MFQAGADMSDTSGDEDDVVPARVGQSTVRTNDSDNDNEEGNNFFRFQRGAPVYPKNMINRNLDGITTTGMRRTTSSIERISLAIRRSLRLARRSESRMAREEQVAAERAKSPPEKKSLVFALVN